MNDENVRLTEKIRRHWLVLRRMKYVVEARLRYLNGDTDTSGIRREVLIYSGRFISPNCVEWIP